LDILKDKWSPALQIRTVLLSIQALLSAPNPDDPLGQRCRGIMETERTRSYPERKRVDENICSRKLTYMNISNFRIEVPCNPVIFSYCKSSKL